jgi:transposase
VESTSPYAHLRNDPDALLSIIDNQSREIERLQVFVANINRKMFVKKSERQIPASEQEELFTFEQVPPKSEPSDEKVTVPEHTRKKPSGRKPLSAELPRRRIEYLPENMTCAQCGGQLEPFGDEITEELEYIPAHFEVIEHAKIKCACPRCKQGVSIGKLPRSVQPLPGARPGAGLLTAITINKYIDHQPLARQEQMFARQGIIIARQRMCDWLAGEYEYLVVLWRLLKKETLSFSYVQADETYIKVHEVETPGQFVQGYFWAVHAPPGKLAFFEYHDTRASEAAALVLKDYKGRVQTDAYAGYNPVLLPEKVERIACMAHIRRRFKENEALAPPECNLVVKQIAKLYAFETEWKELTPERRVEARTKYARPELEKLFRIIGEIQARLLPRHALHEAALNYAVNQREAMFRYLENGLYQIDNNAIERQIRPIALGRKNYLFAGSHDGARRAAVFYSLFATCKLNKINPQTWLTHVLKTMPGLPVARYGELLPHRWVPATASI